MARYDFSCCFHILGFLHWSDTFGILLDAGSSRKKIPASGVSFNDDSPVSRWAKLEETAVVAGGSTPPLRPTLQCFTNATDNRFNPVTFVGGQW